MKNNMDETVNPTGMCGDESCYHVYHDPCNGDSLGETVISAIATVTDVDPTETKVPLGGVDPEALDQLFTGHEDAPGDSRLVFVVWGLEVTVHNDGHIFIYKNET